ncbi:MAG: aminopeptidase [Candidatus Cloacimonetes bacterium]|nr:aminopeptidase [Candidatus Cloacimonadota bacterium]
MNNSDKIRKKLTYQRKNFWHVQPDDVHQQAFAFADGYKKFLNDCKTERETIYYLAELAKKEGFKNIDAQDGARKLYSFFRNKNAAFARLGKNPVSEGVNLIVSHIDAPRIDLKQNPLAEDGETKLGILKTHYYGGIKKYQWMSTPLALHGVFVTRKGKTVRITIGEDKNDPVFIMPDLLPHLAKNEQYSKKLGDAVTAGQMNVIFNSIPFPGDDDQEIKEAVKLNALNLLNKKYGITETDFLSAELELVPAGLARDAGFDGSMIAAYGQDDRVCAYTSWQALLSLTQDPERTAVVYLADKEEIGSESNTGAKSVFILDFIADLLAANGESSDSVTLRKTLIRSQILSADVNAAINPNYPGVHEKDNAVHLGYGVSVTKYTGQGGKSGSNDANAEFNAKVIDIFETAGVNWQTGTLGKVDEGGGGTIAKFMAQYGAEVIDCGPGLLGMHAMYELSSKADVYSTYKAYHTFFEKA